MEFSETQERDRNDIPGKSEVTYNRPSPQVVMARTGKHQLLAKALDQICHQRRQSTC